MTATEHLIERFAKLRFSDLNDATIDRCKTFIVDSIGVALVGHRHALAKNLINASASLGIGEQARVWGTGLRLPFAHAAMMNAFLIHCQEFDCVHEAAVVHPMAVILATLMAECEHNPKLTGADLILGVVAAVDMAATLGMASKSKLKFFRPALASGMAAAASLCKLRGGSAEAIGNTMGLMLGQLSGSMQAHREGVSLLPMQIAFAARNAWTAAAFAEAGLLGPKQMLEGEFGYFNLFETEHDWPKAVAELGSPAILQVSHKPFPSGRATHAGLYGLSQLLDQHQLDRPTLLQNVHKIELFAPPLICQLVNRPAIAKQSPGYLKLCFPYCAASYLITGALDVRSFEAKALSELARYALAERILVLPDDNQDPNALAPVRLRLSLNDGQSYEILVTQAFGHPNCPLSAYQHHDKFLANWRLASEMKNATSGLGSGTFSGSDTFLAANFWLSRAENLESLSQASDLLADLPMLDL